MGIQGEVGISFSDLLESVLMPFDGVYTLNLLVSDASEHCKAHNDLMFAECSLEANKCVWSYHV